MHPTIRIPFAFLLLLALTACQKEIYFPEEPAPVVNNPANPVDTTTSNDTIVAAYEGDWKLLYIDVDSKTVEANRDNGTLTEIENLVTYRTKNNSGTCKITSDRIVFQNLGYTVDASGTHNVWIDGMLSSSSGIILYGNIPASAYQIVYEEDNETRLVLQQPFFPIPNANNVPTSSPATGQAAVLEINGNIMEMAIWYDFADPPGIPGFLNQYWMIDAILTFERIP